MEIDISVEPDHVCLRCTGTYSLPEAKRVCQSAVDAALLYQKAKVLIDVNGVIGNISTLDRYTNSVFLAELVVGRASGRICRISIAGHVPLIDEDRFGETVAVNRGVNAKVVTSLDEAIAWLTR